MNFTLIKSNPRQGVLNLAQQTLTTPILVPHFHMTTTAPLTAMELARTGTKLIAVDLMPAMNIFGLDLVRQAGGLGALMAWPNGVVVLAGFETPLVKIKKNCERVGVHYQAPLSCARQTVNGIDFVEWQSVTRATIQLPLNQAPYHYAPINDINRAVEINATWDKQTSTSWGVVQGAGLMAARRASLTALLTNNKQGFYLGGFDQLIEISEWQRAFQMSCSLLPAAFPRMVTANSLANLRAALAVGVDLVISDLPFQLAMQGLALGRNLIPVSCDQAVTVNDLTLDLAGLPQNAFHVSVANRDPLAIRLLVMHNLRTFNRYFATYQIR